MDTMEQIGQGLQTQQGLTDEYTVARDMAQLTVRPDAAIVDEPLTTSVGRLVAQFIALGSNACVQAANLKEAMSLAETYATRTGCAEGNAKYWEDIAKYKTEKGEQLFTERLIRGKQISSLQEAVEAALRSRTITAKIRKTIEAHLEESSVHSKRAYDAYWA